MTEPWLTLGTSWTLPLQDRELGPEELDGEWLLRLAGVGAVPESGCLGLTSLPHRTSGRL